ncbi:hypothetical protein [Nonomuraea sp. NPDC049646]|uniref:hypothetical protein n=1 Tax=unclassified Nonomuraea TaxID=2593643 RepID=UPI00378733D6
MAKTYRVVGACVTNLPVSTAQGTQLATFYTGSILPEAVPADRVKHLLSVGLIEEVPGEAKPTGATPTEPTATGSSQQTQPPDTVNGRSSKGDLVEYGVARGANRDELDNMTREQLLERYVRTQQS